MPDPYLMSSVREAEEATQRAAGEATHVLGHVDDPRADLACQALAAAVIAIAGAKALIEASDP